MNPSTSSDFAGRKVTWTEIDQTLALDYSDRARRLSRLWPALPRRVAERYWGLWDQTRRHEQIMDDQAERQFSRSSPWVPPSGFHEWRRELYECALHDVIPALRRHLVTTGRSGAVGDDPLEAMINPNATATAARGRSRILRPHPLPLPIDAVAAHRDPLELEEGRYAGWTVGGYSERQLEEIDHGHRGRQTSAHGALMVPPYDVSDSTLPFAAGRGDFAWHRQGLSQALPEHHATGAVVQWWVQHDALGWDRGLTLGPALRLRLKLVAAPLPAPFDLIDEEGVCRVVWRRWWMRPFSYAYGPTTPLLAGGALLLSPPTAQALVELLGPPRFVVIVEDKDLYG